jgi:hypothetical protein
MQKFARVKTAAGSILVANPGFNDKFYQPVLFGAYFLCSLFSLKRRFTTAPPRQTE